MRSPQPGDGRDHDREERGVGLCDDNVTAHVRAARRQACSEVKRNIVETTPDEPQSTALGCPDPPDVNPVDALLVAVERQLHFRKFAGW